MIFLSNFYPCEVGFAGIVYPSVEHAYQAAKTVDPEERQMILALPTAGAAKRAGRKLTLREDWNDMRYHVMWELLLIKFKDPVLRNKLLLTAPEELVEGNTWGDTYWGVCNDEGENTLGKILIHIRNQYTYSFVLGQD